MMQLPQSAGGGDASSYRNNNFLGSDAGSDGSGAGGAIAAVRATRDRANSSAGSDCDHTGSEFGSDGSDVFGGLTGDGSGSGIQGAWDNVIVMPEDMKPNPHLARRAGDINAFAPRKTASQRQEVIDNWLEEREHRIRTAEEHHKEMAIDEQSALEEAEEAYKLKVGEKTEVPPQFSLSGGQTQPRQWTAGRMGSAWRQKQREQRAVTQDL